MLSRLLKYEFMSTSRFFLPMFAALAAATVLLKLSFLFSEDSIFVSMGTEAFLEILHGLLIAVYVIVIAGTLILSTFLLIRRFYTNLFGDEGYLTHTLPVTAGQLLNSKLICAFTWQLVLIPVCLASFLILFLGTDTYDAVVYYAPSVLEEIYILDVSGFSITAIIIEVILMIPLAMISSLLTYYTSITLGQHFMGNHRLLGAIVFYFVLSIINSTVNSVFTTVAELFFYEDTTTVYVSDIFPMIIALLGISILLNLIMSVAYYLVTRYLLTRKLNL